MTDVEEEEEEEEDYMNDEIVKQCETAAASSKKLASSGKGGFLLHSSLASASTLRQIAIKKKQEREAADAKRMNPRVRLEEGLATAISEHNVGFKLLTKMGFKPGAGLGKSQSGRVEPIPLEFRQGRSGLGREAIRSRLDAERDAARQRLVEKHRQSGIVDEKQFADLQKRKMSEFRIRRDFYSARKACLDLDSKLEIFQPFKDFYWPEKALPKKEEGKEEVVSSEDEEEGEESPGEQLEELSAYLRLQHSYCLWCGTVFEGKEDLEVNCPGPSAEFHDL